MPESLPFEPAVRVGEDELARFITEATRAAGADQASAAAVTRALVGASLRGVDTHGVRLLPQYTTVLADGRVKGAPTLRFERRGAGVGLLDGGDGLGHRVGYAAIDHGIELAEKTGLAAVSVIHSTHFGPAGAYPLAAAERGYMALCCCNTDKIVLPFEGTAPFHGTNPIAFAAPVPDGRPYLIDMATSPIPWNRVLQYRALGRPLPADVVVDENATPTRDADLAKTLLPFGGPDFGYKAAALASLVEVLCAALTGARFSHEVPDDAGPDFAAPRSLGQFFLVLKPTVFLPADAYAERMAHYLTQIRGQSAQPGSRVMAPGDREWAVEAERRATGVPIDPAVWDSFREIGERFGVDLPHRLG